MAGCFQNLLIFLNFVVVLVCIGVWTTTGKDDVLLDVIYFFGGSLVGQAGAAASHND